MSAVKDEAAQPPQMPETGPAETQSALINSPGHREADGYIKVFFSVENGPGNVDSKEGHCSLKQSINSLMVEFAVKLGIPGDCQKWYHGEQLLDGRNCLKDYGINGITKGVIIRVEANMEGNQ